MSDRDADLRMLAELLDGFPSELKAFELEAFAEWRSGLDRRAFHALSERQRAWLSDVYRRIRAQRLYVAAIQALKKPPSRTQ